MYQPQYSSERVSTKCVLVYSISFHSDVFAGRMQSELWLRTVRGVHPQVDGDRRYAFVGPGDTIRLPLDLLAHLIEVGELLPFAVEEFSPF